MEYILHQRRAEGKCGGYLLKRIITIQKKALAENENLAGLAALEGFDFRFSATLSSAYNSFFMQHQHFSSAL